MENRKENLSPIVKLKKLNLQDLLLKGVRIIKDESAILQEEVEGRRTRPKMTKRYFVEENSESDDSYSVKDYPGEEYKPKKKKPKKKYKYKFINRDSEDDSESDSQEESTDDAEKESEEKKPKRQTKVSKPKSVELTEYEKLIQKNKEEQLAFLDSLKIDEIKESFAEAVGGFKPKRRKYKKKPVSPIIPRINQMRSAKANLDLSEEALVIKAMMAYDNLDAAPKKLPQVITFKEALEEREYEDFTENFNVLEEYSTEAFRNYESHFRTMNILGNQDTPFKGSRISCVSFHPMREKIIIASSCSSFGKIGLWDAGSNSNSYVFEAHSEGITHLKFKHDQPNILVSASNDGTVRCGDIEKKVFNEVYKASEYSDCTYFDFVSPETFLVALRNGNVSLVDIRKNGKISKTHHCHDSAVKSVSVNPLNKNYFITAQSDMKIRLWDLRRLTKKPTLEFLNQNKNVTSALFSPDTGKHILTSSFNAASLYYSLNLTQILHKNTIYQRKAKTFKLPSMKAAWLPNTDDIFAIGNRCHRERIEICNDIMRCFFSYKNLHCTYYPQMFHPSLPVLAAVDKKGHISILGDENT